MKTCLVVASGRPGCLREFLSAWKGPAADWDEMVVVEDGPTKSFDLPADVHAHAGGDAGRILGDDAWIISRRDTAVKSLAVLMACRTEADLIVILDDDCLPHDGRPICAGHLAAMEGHSRWVSSVPGMRVRGLPYRNQGRFESAVNVGLWSNVPDLDAVTTLKGMHPVEGFEPPPGNWIVPRGQYVPTCGMNLAFRREVAPLMYFGLQGDGWPFRRFDDVWMGVIAKKIMDHLGLNLSVGEPFIRHTRASDPHQNLILERPGLVLNETFWETVDAATLTASTPADCMGEMGDFLRCKTDPYLSKLGEAIGVWAGLFR